ncbi:MAG TPA: hypothetical protein VJ372_13385 [Pyrinomonadaceae bacterium]|nr:hypothetical protein [Pyrinomonadaceae bacterium]
MSTSTLEKTLDQLDSLKTQFGVNQSRKISSLLTQLHRLKIQDPYSLIRLHEVLLFLRAHPHNAALVRQTETLLRAFPIRLVKLQEQGVDLSALEHPDVSGIAGLSVTDTFTYPIVRWLQQRNPRQIDFYWDWFESENRLAEVWPRFMPLLEEDTSVEANIPYRDWLRDARGRQSEVEWLLTRLKALGLSDDETEQLYNGMQLYVCWRYSYRDSRTGMRVPVRKIFFHDGPMIQRRDLDFKQEIDKPSPHLERLSSSEGHRAIDIARDASTVRYRELYGFTNGDPKRVHRTLLGRGIELVVISLPPGKRLPLRAYHSAMIYKNGVPIGYFEGLSFFERMESGFNLYYTFREGETAWLYAKILSVMRRLTGASSFSLDPYQIGFENEEGIQSGAFWFYRKLGFRSTRRSIQKLSESEEEKISRRKSYRTTAATLRRLAAAPMILEMDERRKGDWDRFQVRNIGLAVQRLMAEKFDGDMNRMRKRTLEFLADNLGVDSRRQGNAFVDFADVFALVPEFRRWSEEEKKLLKEIIHAKESDDEARYLRLMQKHERFREAMLRVGSISHT